MTDHLRIEAEHARYEYRIGLISREEAARRIEPYKLAFNEAEARIAKKYGMKPKRFSLIAYLR